MENALAGFDYTGVLRPTFRTTRGEKALELAPSKVASDDAFLGVDDINARITALHELYTPEEMARYRQLARDCAEIQAELANWVESGMTERQVVARTWQPYLERGIALYVWWLRRPD